MWIELKLSRMDTFANKLFWKINETISGVSSKNTLNLVLDV